MADDDDWLAEAKAAAQFESEQADTEEIQPSEIKPVYNESEPKEPLVPYPGSCTLSGDGLKGGVPNHVIVDCFDVCFLN